MLTVTNVNLWISGLFTFHNIYLFDIKKNTYNNVIKKIDHQCKSACLTAHKSPGYQTRLPKNRSWPSAQLSSKQTVDIKGKV